MTKPTVKQILSIQKRIDDARSRVDKLISKRDEMLEASDLIKPRGLTSEPTENFVKVDDKACRIKIHCWGEVVCEELPF
jgi:hypothetical protein